MHSRNLTVFLLVIYYYLLPIFGAEIGEYFENEFVYPLILLGYFPFVLILRSRLPQALLLVVTAVVFVATVAFVQFPEAPFENVFGILIARPFYVYAFLFLLLPGFFMVSELEAEMLPHELAYWSGLRIFSFMIVVFAGRERFLRRFEVIREICFLRGVDLSSRWQCIRRVHVWAVPLISSAICEAAFASKYRDMVGSEHRFIPAHPKNPKMTGMQKVFAVAYPFILIIGIQ